ncbi:MAG: AmmeMemoRadiSam system radical SAM enzyme, partial [Ktedonobacterales bacterium]
TFYRAVANTDRVEDILPIAQQAKNYYRVHVEVVRNLMPGLNDGEDEVRQLATLVLQLLGADTPLHFTTYVPYAMMTHVPPTPPATLARARQIALHTGLQFVYTDNVTDPSSAYTRCPVCDTLVVTRTKARVVIEALAEDGACACCGSWLGMRMRTSVSRRT